jgi:hypothetical protein
MLTATEGRDTTPEPETTEALSASWIEMSDEEILAWLTASILDEPDPGQATSEGDPGTADFWDQVAVLQARLSDQGYPGAVQQAIGLVGLESSLAGESTAQDAPGAFSTGDAQLFRLQAELVERAGRAVAQWAALQGSALRAAVAGKG